MARIWLIGLMFVPCVCPAQVTGTFSMEKAVFAPGEPVYLSLMLHNGGKESEDVVTADPYSFCSGYRIRITRDSTPAAACFRASGGSCMSSKVSLAPGASRTERILLNNQGESRGEVYVPVKEPGSYNVEASYTRTSPESTFGALTQADVQKTFHLRVDENLTVAPVVYSALVQQLASSDVMTKQEAARTLATLAPPALEPILLTFATSKDYLIKQFAPLALANLNTKASLAALAEMLVQNKPGSYEFSMAASLLGKTHDPVWLPLLLEVADQHGGMYLRYAAQSGGDSAIPALLARVRSRDEGVRNAAISALGEIGSRAAIPILIGFLGVRGSPNDEMDHGLARSAESALMELTHVHADSTVANDPQIQSRWQHWWFTSGATAEVYRPEDCAAYTKLP